MRWARRCSVVALLTACTAGPEGDWQTAPIAGRVNEAGHVQLDGLPYQACSEPPDDSVIIRLSHVNAWIHIGRTGGGLVLDSYPDMKSEMEIIGSREENYSLAQPYEVWWGPELYWSNWTDPLDMQLEYTEEWGHYDASVPYFPYFFFDHTLTGSDGRKTWITDIAWWSEEDFVPYTFCISHFRPDRLSFMLTIDPSRSGGHKSTSTPFPITVVADWSDGEMSGYSSTETVNEYFADYSDGFFYEVSWFGMTYYDITESELWGDLLPLDTGSAE